MIRRTAKLKSNCAPPPPVPPPKALYELLVAYFAVTFASDSTSQQLRRDTVRLPSAPWAHESQRFVVTRITA